MEVLESRSFAGQLRLHRLAAGLTQAELAENSGLSLRAISDLERGIKRAPRPHTITLLARTLRLSKRETARLAQSVPRRRGPRQTSGVGAPGAGGTTIPQSEERGDERLEPYRAATVAREMSQSW